MSALKIQSDLARAEKLVLTDPKTWSLEDVKFFQAHIKELDEIKKLKEGLPHLYGFPWYHWALRIFESKNRVILCTAANQISKSATMTRKIIHWATAPHLWPELWPNLLPGQTPSLMWYMLPTLSVATTEFETKWEPQYLPRGEYKNHPIYGWKAEFHKGEIHQICFNSGVIVQFRSYTQKPQDLQTASVYFVVLDEECPSHLIPEISARLNATDGYLASCFTATMGQDFWRRAMEPIDVEEETYKDALKISVSLFDSMKYADGSPSPWTEDKIKRAIQACPTEAEIQRRIYGRFVKSEGLLYESFSLEKNLSEAHPLPKDWQIFSAVDPGSGGKSGHPSAIIFIAVNPEYTEGRVFRAWRGDGIPTTSTDIILKYRELRGNLKPLAQIYDYSARDFFLVSGNMGEAFQPADKRKDNGVAIVNSLFKNQMLKIQKGDPELQKLVQELCSLGPTSKKQGHTDDISDCLKYCCAAIPWNFSKIDLTDDQKKEVGLVSPPPRPLTESELRKEWFLNSEPKSADLSPETELDLWNSLVSDYD